MPTRSEWNLGLIDSAWFGSQYEGQPGRLQTRRIGFDSIDLFVGFDPGRMTVAERQAYVDGVRSVDLPVISLVCTCLGLNDFNPAIRNYHIERAKNVVELAAAFPTVKNLCFVPGEYMFQQKLLPPSHEWGLVVEATRQVGKHAADRGLELAIELLPFEFAFVKSLDTMERFLDEIGLENVKATIDISHLWLMRISPDEIGRLRGRMRTCTFQIATASTMATCRPGAGTRRSINTWRQYAMLVSRAPRRSSWSFRPIRAKCSPGARRHTERP